MNTKSITITLLALSLATTAMAQTETNTTIGAQDARPRDGGIVDITVTDSNGRRGIVDEVVTNYTKFADMIAATTARLDSAFIDTDGNAISGVVWRAGMGKGYEDVAITRIVPMRINGHRYIKLFVRIKRYSDDGRLIEVSNEIDSGAVLIDYGDWVQNHDSETNSGQRSGLTRRTSAETHTSVNVEREEKLTELGQSLRRISFEEAAKSKEDNGDAMLRLAFAFAGGREVDRDIRKMEIYLEKAGEHDNGLAQYVWGLCLAERMLSKPMRGPVIYHMREKRWRETMAKMGWPTGLIVRPEMHNVRGSWFMNKGVTEDQRLAYEIELAEKALDCFEKAVTNGIAIAQEDLDFMRKELADVTKELEDYRAAKQREKEEKEQSYELKRRNEELLKGNQGE